MTRLGYYTPQFPFPQGASAGPYPQFVGRRPRVPCVMMAPKKTGCGCHSHNKCQCHGKRKHRGLRGLGDDTAGLPAGTQLVYNASWQNSILSKMSTAGTAGNSSYTAAAVTAPLGANGIVVDQTIPTGNVSGLVSGTSGFTLKIHTSVGFTQASDVQGIIDHQVYLALGLLPNAPGGSAFSSIAVSALAAPIPNSSLDTPTTPSTPGSPNLAAAAQDWSNYQTYLASGDMASAAQAYAQWQIDSGATTPNSTVSWLENNAVYVAGGVVALALLWRMA